MRKDDVEPREDEEWPDEETVSAKHSGPGSRSKNFLPVAVGVLIAVVLAATIFYFIAKRPPGSDASLLQMKLAAFEEKISSLERQISDLQGKLGTPGTDPALLQRLDDLARKVEALEKRAQPQAKTETKPVAQKPTGAAEKRYHTVRKGETLYKISRTYRITVETLRKLNNLSADQPVRVGQKLLVSSGK